MARGAFHARIDVGYEPRLDDPTAVAHGAKQQHVGEAGCKDTRVEMGLALLERELMPTADRFAMRLFLGQFGHVYPFATPRGRIRAHAIGSAEAPLANDSQLRYLLRMICKSDCSVDA